MAWLCFQNRAISFQNGNDHMKASGISALRFAT